MFQLVEWGLLVAAIKYAPQKRPLRLLVVMLAAIVPMLGAERLLIGTVVRALATKAAH